MYKKRHLILFVLFFSTIFLAACGSSVAPDEVIPSNEEEGASAKICEVTDVGGIDDKSFNATAWAGVQQAAADLGVEGQFLESQQQTDYEANITAFMDEGCDLIISIGFLLGDATEEAAENNPDQNFAIIDFAYDPGYDNVLGIVFATDQAAFLAGYAAAATTQTGIVGTFGGIKIPSVTVFMDGYVYGVEYYNQQNDADVEVLGWEPGVEDGLFAGNFESLDDGRTLAISLMNEGADVIMPVAGPVGLGAAAAVQESGEAWIIGVDSDWTQSSPEYADVILTSVLKRSDSAIYQITEELLAGDFSGGLYLGTLKNDGVGIAPLTNFDGNIDDELAALVEDIIAGDLQTAP
ncbi:MAG: BMP family ABC transporter substrate-binding protein [Chloroflexi bacterium]|nr:MAG: BMP family ABC transporter substrate-binding protein [Chloroflexota bacterium]MBL1196831.1 BMP family ABC transporter substrate-binding protein [Chloroflexota bacterium]NOH14126.1 BMP family ABC transporter substrate-binding protein [Chloroflexota bacterium]